MNFNPFPTLTSERLLLRRMTMEDLKEFFILKSDERLLKNYHAKAKTYEEARRFLQKLDDDISANECVVWGITLKSENKVIGSICYWNLSEDLSKAEIGYELMHEFQGKGIMTEAIQAVIAYGFNDMNLQRIEAVPFTKNSTSIKVLEKNNFLRGETFKETDPDTGEILEQVLYTLENKGS
jgi:[ribosomal protein S5]-alanine N-acetyltransferase